MRKIYKPKMRNEEKLNAFIERLEKKGVFKEELKDGKNSKYNSIR